MWIHIGCPRAASTTLQRLFTKHDDVIYLNNLKYDSAFTEILRSVHRTIYSEEGLCLESEKKLWRMFKLWPAARMLYVLRNQYTILPSLYVENIKLYGGGWLEHYVDRKIEKGPDTFEAWLEIVFGSENNLRAALHYGNRIEYIKQFAQVNIFMYEGMAKNLEGFCRSLSKTLEIDQKKTYEIVKGAHLNKSETVPELPDAWRKVVHDEFAESNKKLPIDVAFWGYPV